MSNTEVRFWDYTIPEGEWNADPGNEQYSAYPDTIILLGRYEDPESEGSWIDYTIFLRPWGARWEDLEERMLPRHYTDWYLPLIEAGSSMPDDFDLY